MPGMARRTTAPVSRRERPAKPALTRAGIVAAAVGIMQAEGLERVTMRRLAERLDTGAASLYVYLRNTAELHAAILDELLASVDLSPAAPDPGPEAGDWRARLIALLRSYTGVLFEHPSLAQAALVIRPSGPHFLDLFEAVLRLLAAGGVPDKQAAWGADLLLHLATSTAAEQGTREQAAAAPGEEELLAAAIRDAPAGRYPRIAALGADLMSGPGSDRFDWAISATITGIARTRRPRQPRS